MRKRGESHVQRILPDRRPAQFAKGSPHSACLAASSVSPLRRPSGRQQHLSLYALHAHPSLEIYSSGVLLARRGRHGPTRPMACLAADKALIWTVIGGVMRSACRVMRSDFEAEI